MARVELVLVHGRSQQNHDAAGLKAEWLTALREGLAKSNLTFPLAASDVHFPYYGDTLAQLVDGKSEDEAAPVIVRGEAAGADENERQFVSAILQEALVAKGISLENAQTVADMTVIERGPLNWGWVQNIIRVIDRDIPGGGAFSLAVFTHDVYVYLNNPGIRDVIEAGMRQAFTPGVPTVAVTHSLGTVVTYNLLKREGQALGWQVPLFVTLGSPLGVTTIRNKLAPIKFPPCVSRWMNGMDPRDVVPLYALDATHFNVTPAIRNFTDIKNRTANRHGIVGYLDDARVAKAIVDELNGTPAF